MVDFENGKREQIEVLKRSTAINLTQEEKNEYKNYKPQETLYNDKFIVSQIENQRDFYAEYKRKWSNNYEGLKEYRVNQPEHIEPQDIQISNDNLYYYQRIKRRKSARNNAGVWINKLKQISDGENIYSFSLKDNPDTYAEDLMKGILKEQYIQNKKKDIVNDVLETLRGENGQVAALFETYRSEILTLGPEIKIVMDSFTQEPVFDDESVESFKSYIKTAVVNPIQAIKDAVSDAVNSIGTISSKLLDRHAIPQKFEVVKALRDKYETISKLRANDGVNDDVKDLMTELYNKKEDGKYVDKDNFELMDQMYKTLDSDLQYSLDHYGVQFRNRDEDGVSYLNTNNFVKQNAMDGKLTYNLLEHYRNKQHRGTYRITNSYWRGQCQKVLKKDQPAQNDDQNQDQNAQQKKMSSAESNILKTVHMLDAKKADFQNDEKKTKLYERLSEGTNKIASAITEIDRELENSADVFERRSEELKARPELKRQLLRYIEDRKQEQLDLIDRASGYINALKSIALNEDLNTLGKQILMENQVSIAKKNVVPKREVVREQNGQRVVELVDGNPNADGFVMIDNISIGHAQGGMSENLADFAGSYISFARVKELVLKEYEGKQDADSRKVVDFLNKRRAPLIQAFLVLEGKSLHKMNTAEIIGAFDKYTQRAQAAEIFKNNTIELFNEITRQYEAFTSERLQGKSDKEINEMIKSANALRTKVMALSSIKEYVFSDNATVPGLVRANLSEEDRKRLKVLDTEATMKFKVVTDKVEEYRYSRILDRIKAGDTSSDMYTEEEKEDLENIIKKVGFKDGKYKDGKSYEQRLVEYFEDKKLASSVCWMNHAREYGNYKTEQQVTIAQNGTNGLLRQGERKQANIKTIEEILGQQDEEEINEQQLNENELWEEEHHEEEHHEEEHHEEEHHEEEHHDEEHHDEEQHDDGDNNPIINIEEKIRQNKEKRNKRGDLYDQQFELFNKVYAPKSVDDFDLDSQDSLENAKAFLVKCLITENINQFASDQKLANNANADEQTNSILKEAFRRLHTKEFERIIFTQFFNEVEEDRKEAHIGVSKNDENFIWLVNQIKALSAVNSDTIVHLFAEWERRIDYLTENGEMVDPMLMRKVNAVLTTFSNVASSKERNLNVQGIKDSLNAYNPRLVSFSLLKPTGVVKNFMRLKKNDYSFDQHQQGYNSCWAASHTYVVNTYMKVNSLKINLELLDQPKLKPKKFTQNTFINKKNYTVNEKVRPKLDQQNFEDENRIDYKGEARNIENFLTKEKDRMGNPYTVADSVITKIPRTAERHILFTRQGSGVENLTVQENGKLANFVMDKIRRILYQTQTPISILVGMHYYTIIGVNSTTRTIECFDSRKNGQQLNDTEKLSVDNLVEQSRFELIYPEYLDNNNIENIKKEFGLKEKLYKEDGSMDIDENIQNIEDKSLENPVNMMHVHGIEFDKPQNKKAHEFEKAFFNEQIYLPKHLNLPSKLKKGENNQ